MEGLSDEIHQIKHCVSVKKDKVSDTETLIFEGRQEFGRAKHKDMNRVFKKLARMGLNNDQLSLRRPPEDAVIELRHKHC